MKAYCGQHEMSCSKKSTFISISTIPVVNEKRQTCLNTAQNCNSIETGQNTAQHCNSNETYLNTAQHCNISETGQITAQHCNSNETCLNRAQHCISNEIHKLSFNGHFPGISGSASCPLILVLYQSITSASAQERPKLFTSSMTWSQQVLTRCPSV